MPRDASGVPERTIIVDDTSTDIQYIPHEVWSENTLPSMDNVGDNGPVFNGTLRGVTTGPASLVFPFTGNLVAVLGTNTDAGIQSPSWQCFVDNKQLPVSFASGKAANSLVLCLSEPLQDGDHVLTLNVSASSSKAFWVDQIQYVPSLESQLANATVQVDSLDPMLRSAFGSGWTPLDGSDAGNMTSTTMSTFTLNFTGVSLGWFGFTPHSSVPLQQSTGTYSVDGDSSTTFFISNTPANSPSLSFNQKLFQTPMLRPGNHQIVVTYTGDGQTTTPLTLDYLVIQNTTAPDLPSSPDSTTSPSPSSIAPGGTSRGTKMNTGAIAGGVVGAIIVIIALAVLILTVIRRRRRAAASRKDYIIDGDEEDDSDTAPRPYHYMAMPSHTTMESGRDIDAPPSGLPMMSEARRKGAAYHATNPSTTIRTEAGDASVENAVPHHARGKGQHRGPSSLPVEDDSPPAESQYVRHEDSGIRLPGIIEVPPGYTSL